MEWELEQGITSHDALGIAFGDIEEKGKSKPNCIGIANF